MKFRIFLVVASCVVSLITGFVISRSGSSTETVGARAKPLIGLSMDTLKEERWQGDRDLFVTRARGLGADVLVQSANSDDTRQISDVQALISRRVDVLVIVPHNGAAMAKAVNMAHDAGIPVLAYDRLITDCDLDLYMTFDNEKVGELQAQFLVNHLLKERTKKIVRIYGAKTDNNALLYKRGQDKVLTPLIKKGEIEVVHEDWTQDWRPENAKKIASAAITKAGANFDAILASNDGTAGGAIQALSEEGLAGKILVTGQDAELRLPADSQRHPGDDDLQTAFAACQTSCRSGGENGEEETSFYSRQNRQQESRSAFDPARRGCDHKGKHDGYRRERWLSQGRGRLSQSARCAGVTLIALCEIVHESGRSEGRKHHQEISRCRSAQRHQLQSARRRNSWALRRKWRRQRRGRDYWFSATW